MALTEAQSMDLTAKINKWLEKGKVKVVGVRHWSHHVSLKDGHGREVGAAEQNEIKLVIETPLGTLWECALHPNGAENLYKASCGDKYAKWLLDTTGTVEKPKEAKDDR